VKPKAFPFHRLAEKDLIVAGNYGGEGEMHIPPFDAVAIDVSALWSGPLAAPAKP
jgi:hypothetical protein